MPRKISAVAFMLVMTLLITLKHPVLGYCLCLNSYFTGDCTCEVVQTSQTAPSGANCSSCCTDDHGIESIDIAKMTPCDDCTQRLDLNVGDFVWNTTVQLPSDDQDQFNDLTQPNTDPLLLASIFSPGHAPIRGDPPPLAALASEPYQGFPIYLRHSVLRL
ncbi:hypothetical protein JIN77_08855 [Verrucomicrobiaceae bacterium R5-34]|uniref:Uncharacterized protein n=1 Tax=Oceaniferula flava TaxID=2800421 RepID=A0AAE2SE06_9BACT|nr:hypothetical protein [Oceaniferula flavus]MBK1830832.1 hypothetical protein [Verrucomicrobiaceae bacterium R5-34]MBK1856475.1 hypothetical protein [Oceaniferula flavus]MBM1137782.1 hypothetical protein [Oceaniferula flavus]